MEQYLAWKQCKKESRKEKKEQEKKIFQLKRVEWKQNLKIQFMRNKSPAELGGFYRCQKGRGKIWKRNQRNSSPVPAWMSLFICSGDFCQNSAPRWQWKPWWSDDTLLALFLLYKLCFKIYKCLSCPFSKKFNNLT